MKYTVTIKNKDFMLPEGFLRVQVEFQGIDDPKRIINDSFDSVSMQDEQWLNKKITDRLKQLEELDDFIETIPLGEFKIDEVNTKSLKLNPQDLEYSAKQEYKEDLVKFTKLVGVLRQGFIENDNETFINLQNKLKQNFNPEYLDLF